MVASDLGFLALGGILGLLAGAALIAILRTRPPAPRQIRLTVTPGSVPVRPSRTTLGIDPFTPEARWVAHGEPSGLSRLGPEVAAATALAGGARNGTLVRSEAPHDGPPTGPEEGAPTAAASPAGGTESVGIDIGSGPDPVLAAIAASGKRLAQRDGDREDVVVVVERPGEPGPFETTEDGLGVAILEAAIRARRAGTTAAAAGTATSGATSAAASTAGRDDADVTGSVAVMTRPAQAGATNSHRPEARARGTGAGASGGQSGDRPAGDGQAASAEPEQCAEARTTVDERCALAQRMRVTAGHAAELLREAQGTYDAHIAQAAAAEAIADTRAQRAAKDGAQNRFRTERARAGSREAVEQAARDWLQEINRINAAAREAGAALAREREAAAALQASIERLTIDADAARVQAESAEESCTLARKNLAACEEAVREAARAPGRGPSGGGPAGSEEVSGGAPAGVPAPTRVTRKAAAGLASTPLPAPVEEEGALAAAVHAGANPAVMSLLTGDRTVLQRLVWELAGEDPVNQRRWQIQLADLIDAIVSRAIEACAFIFPEEHPFWEPFNRRQGRDIALALSSLGFRFDGLGGFADDRIPAQRDLSLALGYAGLDPMRVRRWPSEGEFEELYREVTVAADEYILGAAPGLTLGELVGILGRRADPLTEVWNAWAQIRPILLEEVPA
ncbi:MAG: hypothetical protein M3P84_07500 [Chloroflexota bacterium]|nr:hypothetical protein [Chloroflexota bacterium]